MHVEFCLKFSFQERGQNYAVSKSWGGKLVRHSQHDPMLMFSYFNKELFILINFSGGPVVKTIATTAGSTDLIHSGKTKILHTMQ